jgi:hypothetical protein
VGETKHKEGKVETDDVEEMNDDLLLAERRAPYIAVSGEPGDKQA